MITYVMSVPGAPSFAFFAKGRVFLTPGLSPLCIGLRSPPFPKPGKDGAPTFVEREYRGRAAIRGRVAPEENRPLGPELHKG